MDLSTAKHPDTCRRVDDGYGGVGVAAFLHEHSGKGFADDVGSADDNGVFAAGFNTGTLEQFDNAPGCTGFEDGVVADKPLYFFLERYMQSFRDEMLQFVDAVLNDKETPTTGADGLNSILVALAAKKSVAEGRPVKVSEIY